MANKSMPSAGPHTAGIFADMTVDGPEIGTLVIIFDRAKNLPNRKSMGKQNPYCAARLGKEAKKTETDQRGGQTPRWDQEIRFTVHDSPDYHNLKISVFSEDKKTDLIGEAWIALEQVIVPGGGKSDLWQGLTFKGKYAGELRVEMTYYDSRPKPDGAKEMLMVQDDLRQSIGGSSRVKRRPLPSGPNTSAMTPDTIPPVAVPGRAKHGPRDYRTPPPRATSMLPEQSSNFPAQMAPTATMHSFGTSQLHIEQPTQPQHYAENEAHVHPEVYQEAHHHADLLPQLPPSNRHWTQPRQLPQAFPAQSRGTSRGNEQRDHFSEAEHTANPYSYSHNSASAVDYDEEYPNDDHIQSHWHADSHAEAFDDSEEDDAHLPPPPPPPVHSNSAPAVPRAASPLEIIQPAVPMRHYSTPPSAYTAHATQQSRPEQYNAPSQASYVRSSPQPDKYVYSADANAYATSPSSTQFQTSSPHGLPVEHRQQHQQQHQHQYQQQHQHQPQYPPQHHQQHHQHQQHPQHPQHQQHQQYRQQHQVLQRQEQPQQQPHRPHRHSMIETSSNAAYPRQYYTSQQIPRARSPLPIEMNAHEHPEQYDHDTPPIIRPQPISPADQHASRQSRSTYSIQHPVRSFESSDASPLAHTSQAPKRKSVSPRPSLSGQPATGVPFGPDSFDVHNPNARVPVVPNGASPHSPYQIKPGTEQREETSGPIVGWHGQEIDPSDHLPIDSWAPEPIAKTPAKTYGLSRDRDFGPRNAQSQQTETSRISRDTVINIRNHSTPASQSTPSPPTSGRNRLVKKSSPVVTPLREHDNYNPATVPRTQPKYHRQSSEPVADHQQTGYGFATNAPSHGGYGAPVIPPKVPIEHFEHPSDALSRDIASIDIGSSRNRRSVIAPSPTAYVPVRSHRERHSVYY